MSTNPCTNANKLIAGFCFCSLDVSKLQKGRIVGWLTCRINTRCALGKSTTHCHT